MAADANLIKGAAAAYGAGTAAKQAGGDALGSMAAGLIGRVDARTADVKKRTEEAKERGRILDAEADKRMEDVSLKANALGEEEYRLNSKKVNGWKKELNRCALGDDACRREVMAKMSMQSQNLQAEKEARKDNQKLYKTLSLGVNPVDKYAMSVYSDPQRGDYTITEDVHGVKSYKIKFPEGMELPIDPKTNKPKDTYTEDEINKLFNKQADLTSTKMTKDMAVDQIKIGNQGGIFDETKIKGSYEDAIGDDLMSAINDDWGVGSFRKNARDLVEAELKASPIDIDGDGANDDIDAVMSALTDPKDPNYALMPDDVRKGYVVNYFVDAQRQQHEQGKRQAQQAALAKQREDEFTLYKETHKNNLRIALENAKDENERNQIAIKFENDMKKKAQDYYNNVNEETDKLAVQQSNAESQWNAITFDKGEKPVSKAQTYMENFRDVLGDDVTDIRYGTNFVDEQGNTQAKGYYAVINVDDGKGGTKEVNQLISKSDDLTYDNVNRYLDPEKMRIKKPLPKPASVGNSGFDVDAID